MPSITHQLYRGDEVLELEVEFSTADAEPDIGIMGPGAIIERVQVYSKAERAWITLELTGAEIEKVETWINENYEFDDRDAWLD